MTNSPNKKISELPQYYNRFDDSQGFDEALFLAGRGLQSAELNEIQSMGMSRIQRIGDALFQEGEVMSGAHCAIDSQTGETSLEAGQVYLQGAVRAVGAAQLRIPLTGTVQLGICVAEKIVTEADDPTLRDPALGCRNYQEGGAARLQRTLTWTHRVVEPLDGAAKRDTDAQTDEQSARFYPIYRVVKGVWVPPSAPSQGDALRQHLARYDRDSHGNYVIDGLTVGVVLPIPESSAALKAIQSVVVSEGRARINGVEVRLPYPIRQAFVADPDTATVKLEAHRFVPDNGSHMTVTLDRFPVAAVERVEVTLKKVLSVTRGFGTAVDALPESVLSVLSVAHYRTAYRDSVDYRFEKGCIDWSLDGREPSPGTVYSVLCQVRTTVPAEQVTETGFVVRSLVSDSLILVDYTWYLPRVDTVALTTDGTVARVKGTRVSSDWFALARLHQTWSQQSPPRLEAVATRAIPMSALEALRASVKGLEARVAELGLVTAVNQTTAEAKKAVWIDAFLDDGRRDPNEAQTGAIGEGFLTLPMAEDNTDTVTRIALSDTTVRLLPFTPVVCLARDGESADGTGADTESTAVNFLTPTAFREMPSASVQLPDALDRWTHLAESPWTSAQTQRFSPTTRVFQESTEEMGQRVRGQTVPFVVKGFSPGEKITVFINGEADNSVSSRLFADGSGERRSQVTLSGQLPVGRQRLTFRGSEGHRADRDYWVREWVDPVERRLQGYALRAGQADDTTVHWDSLVQTFTLEAGRHVCGIEFWVCHRSRSVLTVQLREVIDGVIGAGIYAQGEILPQAMGDVNNAGKLLQLTWSPVWLEGGREYAIALNTMDSDCAVQLGVSETHQRRPRRDRETALPTSGERLYQGGQWRAGYRLRYRLLGAAFSQETVTLDLGEVKLKQASNLVLLAAVDRVAASTQCRFTLVDKAANGHAYSLTENTPLALPESVSGSFRLQAQLQGTATASPVMDSAIQLAQGVIRERGDYVTRAMPAGTDSRVSILYDAQLAGEAGDVEAFVETASHRFEMAALESTRPVGENWRERIHVFSPLNISETRIKLVLHGNASCRTQVRRLRVVIT